MHQNQTPDSATVARCRCGVKPARLASPGSQSVRLIRRQLLDNLLPVAYTSSTHRSASSWRCAPTEKNTPSVETRRYRYTAVFARISAKSYGEGRTEAGRSRF